MKYISLLLLIVISATINSQTNQNSIRLHAVGIGFGGFYIKNNIEENGGASFLIDVTASIHENLITTSYLTGAEIGIVGSSTFNFNEFSILYGRETKPINWLAFELFAGIGYYNQNNDVNPILSDNAVTFPLRLNTKFYFNKKFGMGLNTNYSINRMNNNLSLNLVFHYRVNREIHK